MFDYFVSIDFISTIYRKKALMKVLVTGATGFIGKELIKTLRCKWS